MELLERLKKMPWSNEHPTMLVREPSCIIDMAADAGHRIVPCEYDLTDPKTVATLFDCYDAEVGTFSKLFELREAFKASEKKMRQCWATPPELFKVLDDEFHFTVDCAANEHNHKCGNWIGESVDALKVGWGGWHNFGTQRPPALFLNPGFNNPMPWVVKMNEEVEREHGAVGVVIGLVSPSTKWWMFCDAHASEIRLLGGKRPQFVPPGTMKSTSNSKENAVIIFRHGSRRNGGHATHSTWDWLKDVEVKP